MYNLTPYDNITGIVDLWIKIDTSSGNLMSPIMLFVIAIFIFIISRSYEEDLSKCAILSGTITALMGLLFVFAGIITWTIFMFTIVFLFAGMMMFALRK